jgi:hypothetical protein
VVDITSRTEQAVRRRGTRVIAVAMILWAGGFAWPGAGGHAAAAVPDPTEPVPTAVPSTPPTPPISSVPTSSATVVPGPTTLPPSASATATTSATRTPPATPTPSLSTRPSVPAVQETGTKPAAATSTLPPASIVIALAVLVGAAGVLVYAGRLSRRDAGEGEEVGEVAPGPGAGEDIAARDSELTPDQQGMVAFLVALGEAMIDSGDPVTHVQDTLQRVADANHVSAAGSLSCRPR